MCTPWSTYKVSMFENLYTKNIWTHKKQPSVIHSIKTEIHVGSELRKPEGWRGKDLRGRTSCHSVSCDREPFPWEQDGLQLLRCHVLCTQCADLVEAEASSNHPAAESPLLYFFRVSAKQSLSAVAWRTTFIGFFQATKQISIPGVALSHYITTIVLCICPKHQ